jgi:hypothetical protein
VVAACGFVLALALALYIPKTSNVYLKNSKMAFPPSQKGISKLKKKVKINLDVDNYIFYQYAYFQLEISYIRDRAKMRKSDMYNSEQYKFSKS